MGEFADLALFFLVSMAVGVGFGVLLRWLQWRRALGALLLAALLAMAASFAYASISGGYDSLGWLAICVLIVFPFGLGLIIGALAQRFWSGRC